MDSGGLQEAQVQSYSPGGINVPSREGALAQPGEYEPSTCGGNAALPQISLTTCYYYWPLEHLEQIWRGVIWFVTKNVGSIMGRQSEMIESMSRQTVDICKGFDGNSVVQACVVKMLQVTNFSVSAARMAWWESRVVPSLKWVEKVVELKESMKGWYLYQCLCCQIGKTWMWEESFLGPNVMNSIWIGWIRTSDGWGMNGCVGT